ncbi:Crp/Fnr family transcriptional regulator [Enterovirga sp.]|uniref:Crp/Fnr family transcriptional regulator n=1 Tax=Enterovirga sp. TaxID=2026350 RepID=UPI00260C0DAC|nr:Crp/Fnr family transcriptional regulator [Enterovirga sp.]MDB5591148.1 transcriptional regulator, Crp/Fnr family [Enterovirga sp.]
MTSPRPAFRNQLLASLPGEELAALAPLLDSVTLLQGQVLEAPNTEIGAVYFPESGIASVVVMDPAGRRMEAGPFGRDGMSGVAVLTDAGRSPHETVVQVPGTASRVSAAALNGALRRSPDLHRALLRYVQAFSIQVSHTALAAGVAIVQQRLARWLLMLHDRIDGDELQLTHDFMAMMLAVRRPGVTVALHELEGCGLIRSRRGLVIIRDRAGLVELCAGIYGVPEAEYRRLIVQAAHTEAVTAGT